MNSWDVAQLTANLGDYNIKSKADVKHLERKVKRVVRHKGFDQRTLVGTTLLPADTCLSGAYAGIGF